MFISFAELRKSVSIEQIAYWLGLKTTKANDQLRCACPVHDGGKRALVITPDKGLWYCFAPECRVGGDVIELVAHCRRIDTREAALEIQRAFKAPEPKESKLPEGGLDYLVAEHEAVQALGLLKHQAERLGVGYASRGIMTGRVCFPLRDENGKIIAYCGYSDELDPKLKFPTNFI